MKLIFPLCAVLRRWSFWCASVALAVLTAALTVPDILLHIWNLLPDEARAWIPQDWAKPLAAVMAVLGLISQFLKQEEVAAAIGRFKRWLAVMAAGGEASS